MEDAMPVIDKQPALDRLGGDEELWQDLIEVFLVDFPKQLKVLQDAIAAGNIAGVQQQAHSLKSASASVGAERLRSVSEDLEQYARSDKVTDPQLHDFARQLETEFAALCGWRSKVGE